MLWGVRNSGPSSLFRMVKSGALWSPAAPGGYTKTLVYKNGLGAPDAEGVTLADGDPNAVYVATERDGGGSSQPKILRYDSSSAGDPLAATNEWDLTLDLPGLGPNLGLEAIAFVPDDLLVAKGLIDDAGTKYNPSDYPNHGKGLFFVGVEQTGQVIGYVLNRPGDSFKRIATIASTFSSVMELEYEPETTHLWAMCDNNCEGRSVTLDIGAATGQVRGHPSLRPPRRTWTTSTTRDSRSRHRRNASPDSSRRSTRKTQTQDGNTLRGGTINCTPLPPVIVDPTPTPTPTPQPATPTPTPTATATPTPPRDIKAPSVKLALKVTKSGTYAVRKTGKFARHDHARRAGGPDDLRDRAQERQGEGAHDPEGDDPQGRGRGQADDQAVADEQGAQGVAQGRDPDADRGGARCRGQRLDDEGLGQSEVGARGWRG